MTTVVHDISLARWLAATDYMHKKSCYQETLLIKKRTDRKTRKKKSKDVENKCSRKKARKTEK